jgi:hypothetical protein
MIMANMDYCKFENTLKDLQLCYEDIDNDDLNEYEAPARKKLIKLCCDIADDYRDEIEDI